MFPLSSCNIEVFWKYETVRMITSIYSINVLLVSESYKTLRPREDYFVLDGLMKSAIFHSSDI